MSNRRAGDVYGIPSEAPALPTAVLTLRRRSGASRSRARSSGRFRRLQSRASTMRKLLTWGYVATDSANHGGELGKAPRTPEGRQIRAHFPAKRPRTRGHGTREERSPSGRQLATGGGIQTSGRTTGPSARSPLAPFAPTRSPFAPLFASLIFFRPVRLQFTGKRLLRWGFGSGRIGKLTLTPCATLLPQAPRAAHPEGGAL